MSDTSWRPDINGPNPTAQQPRVRSRRAAPAGFSTDRPVDNELRQACTEFESVFIAYLLKEMRATVDKSGLIDGSRSEQLYESMMDAELARKLSSAGGLGLAQMLCDQLSGKSDSGDRASAGDAAAKGGVDSQKPPHDP